MLPEGFVEEGECLVFLEVGEEEEEEMGRGFLGVDNLAVALLSRIR
jgi:hypothetical protein